MAAGEGALTILNIPLSLSIKKSSNRSPFSGLSGKVVQTDNKKVKLELVSLGMSIILKKQVA